MPRDGRLTSAADFRRTYESGRRATSGSVVVHALATGEPRVPRIGVSASRAIGSAVTRNRAKRRLREAVRSLGRPLEPGVDAVFVATRETRTVEFQELVDSVRDAAVKAGALSA